jgi:hypothetical protein
MDDMSLLRRAGAPTHMIPCAGCVTLAAAHLAPSAAAGGGVVAAQAPSEQVLWSYAVQLAGALRAAHAAGLALRPGCLHPSKVGRTWQDLFIAYVTAGT